MRKLFVVIFKLAFALIVLSIPALGVWVASSLAAQQNGPIWLTVGTGALLFPMLPLAWDAWANIRRRKRANSRPPRLTLGDRIIVRTLTLNILFVGGLLFFAPARAFTAVSARGDWMLDGSVHPVAEHVRRALFWSADQLELVYLAAVDNPYDEPNGDPSVDPQPDIEPEPKPLPPPIAQAEPPPPAPPPRPSIDAGFMDAGIDDAPAVDAGVPEEIVSEPTPEPQARDTVWPLPDTLHPVLAQLSPNATDNVESLAREIAALEPDPIGRVKAVHDWIAQNIRYDDVALANGEYPAQDAEVVLRDRKAVCAGYSKLFRRLTRKMGFRTVFISGEVREEDGQLAGVGHAWNAIQIDGRWYLVDVTWDAPDTVSGKKMRPTVKSTYLLTPPEVFGINHFPKDEKWQLRLDPISRGDFIRQPMMSADFYRQGFRLVSPDRSQVQVSGTFEAKIENLQNRHIMAKYRPLDQPSGKETACEVERARGHIEVLCEFDTSDVFLVQLYANTQAYGRFMGIGNFQISNR